MRIVCPSCSAAYEVPDQLLSGRKAVRCARCAYEWEPSAEQPVPAPPAEPAPLAWPDAEDADDVAAAMDRRSRPTTASALDRLMAPPARPRRSLALRVAWVASIVLVLACIVAAYAWRSDVMAAWPPSQRLYSAMGLAGR